MHQAKRVAKNTGILYGRMLITVFISLYTTRLVLNALGAADYGLFNLVAGAISMLGFLNNAMTTATQRFISFAEGAGDTKRVQQIFNVSVILHISIAIVVFLLLEIAGYFFFSGTLNIANDRLFAAKVVYQCMVVSTLFTVISVPYDAVINAHENMLLVAVLGIIEAVLKLLIAISIINFTSDKLMLYGSLMAFTSILLLLIRRIYCKKNYKECKIDIKKLYDKLLMKSMASFAGWSLLVSVTTMFTFYGQGILLNVFFGTLINAAQSIAAQISGQLGVLSTNMLKALNPIITKSAGANDRDTMIEMAIFGSKISFYLLSLVCIPVIIEMPFILSIWLKKVPEYTVVFCTLVLVKNLIEQIFLTLNTSISAIGNIRSYQISASILTILPLPISYWLFKCGLPPTSLYGVYIVYVLFFAIVTLFFSKKNFNLNIRYFLQSAVLYPLSIFIIELLLSSIPLFFFPAGITRLSFVVTINLLAFIVLVWHIGLNKNERLKIVNIFKNKFVKVRFIGKYFSVD